MPVTIIDRLPLPNLKVYSAGSVLLLSIAVYYAVNVTSDPNWRANATLQRPDGVEESIGSETAKIIESPDELARKDTNNATEQFIEVIAFMTQEPLCMWTLINTAYCLLALFGFLVQRMVFGQLRVVEAQRVKDKFWNYVFYKFIFIFGVLNVQYMDEVLLWCSWFTLIGFLHILGHLCRDRFDYLSSSPNVSGWAHARILGLLSGILLASSGLFCAAVTWGYPAGKDTFAFMVAECALVGVSALHVVARFVLRARDSDAAGAPAYYTHLVFDAVALVTEVCHVAHMVVYSNVVVSMASLVLLMQLRHLLHALLARLRRHRLYTALATHMSRNYPMASPEEVEKNQDNCAICWEPMKEARKLPCSHLFHNSCLCRWVQQDASCPTCRRALSAAPEAPHSPLATLAPLAPLAPLAQLAPLADEARIEPRQPNHMFHFDGSRYVSWLPSFSVEVTRVRDSPPGQRQLETMVAQVQQVFPQYGRTLLLADLAATGSADLTLDNILEGRLHNPPPSPAPATTATAATATTTTSNVTSAEVPADTSGAAAPAPTPSSPLAGAHHTSAVRSEVGETSEAGRFGESASEREADLRRRKERLVAAARRRFLSRSPC